MAKLPCIVHQTGDQASNASQEVKMSNMKKDSTMQLVVAAIVFVGLTILILKVINIDQDFLWGTPKYEVGSDISRGRKPLRVVRNISECKDMASDIFGGKNDWEQFLCQEDCQNLMKLRQQFQSMTSRDGQHKNLFYSRMSYPLKSGCKKLKRLAGRWLGSAYDGDKMVCLDDFPDGKPCLVYSFGLSVDWDFEEQMVKRGCKVFGFDHTTIDQNIKGVHFEPTGISGKDQGKVKTLKTLLEEHNHTKSTLTYFKFDVEGAELEGLPVWIQDGSLNNVLQLGAEFHTSSGNFPQFADIVLKLDALGFKLISKVSNEVYGRTNGNYELMEVLFRKTKICNGAL